MDSTTTPPAHKLNPKTKTTELREQSDLDLVYVKPSKDPNFRHIPSHHDAKYDTKVLDELNTSSDDDIESAKAFIKNDSSSNSKEKEEQPRDLSDDHSIESASLISESSLIKISRQLKEQKTNPLPTEITSKDPNTETQVNSDAQDHHNDNSLEPPTLVDPLHSEGFDNL